MKSIIYIVLLLSIYFGIGVFIGIKCALIVFSIFMLTLATVFIIKKDFYIQYIGFINPKYALIYNSKNTDFRRKHRITDIIGFYIISAIMLFLSVYLPNTTLPFQGNSFVYLIIGSVLSAIVLWQFSLYILKKSNKNASFWFYFTALILSIILVFGLVENYIY